MYAFNCFNMDSKTVEPTTCCIVHSIEIDTVAGELRMPLDKLGKLTDMIKHIEARRTITLKELKSLIGLLSFACHVVAPGRTFLRRLHNLTIGIKKCRIMLH